MARKDLFRVGITLSPDGIYNIGITHGDWNRGCDFVQSVKPLIADFAERFTEAYRHWAEKNVCPSNQSQGLQT